MSVITPREQAEIDRANASDAQPVVFVHGLWLLPDSWDNWRSYFEDRGFVTLAPGWPDDPATTAEARRDPSVFAHKGVGVSPSTTPTSSAPSTASRSSSGTPSVA